VHLLLSSTSRTPPAEHPLAGRLTPSKAYFQGLSAESLFPTCSHSNQKASLLLKHKKNQKKFAFTRLDLGRLFINRYKQGAKPAKSFGYVGGKEYF
jgi:hypothetical protein